MLIEPLTVEQIDTYLAQAGEQLAALRTALASDTALQELAKSPLMLNIMMLAYRDASLDDLHLSGTLGEQRRYLFAAYVERMFRRRGVDERYTREQTLRWLSWLARAMSHQGQSVFLIERLQPDWLPTPWARWQYAMVDRLGSGLIIGLLFGLLRGLAYGGYACLSHFALRFVLWRKGYLP